MPAPIIGELADMMPDTVTIEKFVSETGFGVRSYDPNAVIIGARIKRGHKIVRDANGQEKVSTLQVLLAGVVGITVKDRVTLPARFTPAQPKAIAVEEAADENGPHHERYMF